jgi:hypothetical protein
MVAERHSLKGRAQFLAVDAAAADRDPQPHAGDTSRSGHFDHSVTLSIASLPLAALILMASEALNAAPEKNPTSAR